MFGIDDMLLGSIAAPIIGGLFADNQSNKMQDAAAQAAQQSKFTPYNVSSGYGSANFDTNNHTINTSLNPEYQGLRNNYLSNAGMLGSQLSNFSQGDVSQNYYNKLQQMQQYNNQQQQNSLENDLAAKGMLGSTGGAVQMRGFDDAMNQQSLQNALAGMNYGQQYQQNLMNMYNQNVQGATQMDALPMQNAQLGASVGGQNTQANQFGAQLQYGAAQNAADTNSAFVGGLMKTFTPQASYNPYTGQTSYQSPFSGMLKNNSWSGSSPFSGYNYSAE